MNVALTKDDAENPEESFLKLRLVGRKLDCQAINTVTLTRLSRAVRKHMTEVTTAILAQHLGSDHSVTGISCLRYHAFSRGPIKARPTATGIELGVGLK